MSKEQITPEQARAILNLFGGDAHRCEAGRLLLQDILETPSKYGLSTPVTDNEIPNLPPAHKMKVQNPQEYAIKLAQKEVPSYGKKEEAVTDGQLQKEAEELVRNLLERHVARSFHGRVEMVKRFARKHSVTPVLSEQEIRKVLADYHAKLAKAEVEDYQKIVDDTVKQLARPSTLTEQEIKEALESVFKWGSNAGYRAATIKDWTDENSKEWMNEAIKEGLAALTAHHKRHTEESG